ncbi:cytochrome P450 89A9-like [Humulus lupulus]|uniref:cytochrome P450 89A9-like n=1 Tax=Humulus lupulus TaxID=3486 RepID=UPI002B413C0E|nr:cytochrome P450 89A9-like [Humulus lupulus]
MESLWVILILILFLNTFFYYYFFIFSKSKTKKLPPGPLTFPIFGNFIWLRKSFSELEPVLRDLHTKYGPLVSLHIGPRPAVFVADRSLAHQALIQNGAVFADRPPALPTSKIISSNQHNISSAMYGPTWRLLRRNLTAEILHPSRVESYSGARKWVLDILLTRLYSYTQTNGHVRVMDHFQYAMFCLLVLMCFGDRLEEQKIKEIETAQRNILLSFGRFNTLNFWPSLTKFLFRKRWQEFFQLRKDQEAVLVPLIEFRRKVKKEEQPVACYVDTLLGLELPEEEKKRRLKTEEIVSLCSEFLDAGTDTTSTALQWIMANLVKHPEIQKQLYEEIKRVVVMAHGSSYNIDDHHEIEEKYLVKMCYLRAVILEGLRRHPPGHFVLPHAVTKDVVLDEYVVPKNGSVNFMVAEMGWDPKVWEDPMAFKPERFLIINNDESNNNKVEFDITGSKEIKMMPFGAGRRICPGYGLAILHLEYFVANLVWMFEWNKVNDDDDVDLSEKQEFTVVMKNPLQVRLSPRTHHH